MVLLKHDFANRVAICSGLRFQRCVCNVSLQNELRHLPDAFQIILQDGFAI